MAANGAGTVIHLRKWRYPSFAELNPSRQWEVGHRAHCVLTPLGTQLQPGSPSLVRMHCWQEFSLQLLHCFCSLMRGAGWIPPAKAGDAEPSGESESRSVCRQASSPLWGVGEHIRPYLGSQNGTQGSAIKKQHLSVKIIFTTSVVEFRQIDLTKPS